ncbi:hypothetical protein Ciccas_000168 [Cichlidogyrus casuarinus]|uniref:F5/8 type C domain-containing protein n=1 Tax=Cichlidogyrus casuarinus TaxID=1844966 RepID=A0ABD2QNP2_9PLAT
MLKIACVESSLGLGDPVQIRDCQISASYEGFPSLYGILQIRPGSVGWWAGVRSGTFAEYLYATIQLGKLTTLTRLKTMALSASYKPQYINVYTSMDGDSFSYQEQVSIKYDGTQSLNGTGILSRPRQLRAVRITVSGSAIADAVFTLDLLGCSNANVDANSYSQNPCGQISQSNLPVGYKNTVPVAKRTVLLVDRSTMYYCDASRSQFRFDAPVARCYEISIDSSSQVASFRELGNQPAQLLAIIPSKNTMLALGQGYNSYLLSRNAGRNWMVVPPSTYQQFVSNSTDLNAANSVPWSDPASFSNQVGPCGKYSVVDWKICFDGIYLNAKKLVDWGTACQGFGPP